MLSVPRDVYGGFEEAMDAANVVRGERSSYLKMGHSDVRTTMICTQTVPSKALKEARSPLDFSGHDEGGSSRAERRHCRAHGGSDDGGECPDVE